MVVVQFGKGVVTLVTFEGLRLEEGMPIYLQIIRYLERGIAAGTVRDGDELPSRRVLSARLGVNPNTIQKAFRALEEAGVITSRAGAKSEVSLTPERAAAIRRRLLEEEAAALVGALRQMGLDREQAAALVLQLWDKQEESP
ncbi:GntR family transcriptional regulator [Flavonifractor sp. An10]|uniref:GntR family transcriptional regulator n=1 Tax=Flavonifractor sp. An10 TaxID=1965537 RepID=UPI001FA829AD|nr:GntR family transcriptional regulator [Flavonifractor sp. An10]